MEQFSRASGLVSPLTIEVEREGHLGPMRHSLEQPFALIGRGERADVPLAGGKVSLRHAYLQVIAGEVFCVDLQSRAGVRWDGEPRPSGWVGRGRGVGIGSYRVTVGGEPGDRGVGPGADPGPAPFDPLTSFPPGAGPWPNLVLELLNPGTGLGRWRLDRVLALVGRSTGCTLQLADESVSRYHCSLVGTPAGVWLVDLLGRGGVQVNGEAVRSARLTDGDDLKVGRFLFRLRYEAAPGPAARFSLTPGPSGGASSTPNLPQLRPPEAAAQPARLVRLHTTPVPERGLAEADLVGTLLAPLVYQFGEAQRLFCDQLAEALSTRNQMSHQLSQAVELVQAMGALHREQRAQVRTELEQIRRLSDELSTLRTELALEPPAAPAGGAGLGPAPAVPGHDAAGGSAGSLTPVAGEPPEPSGSPPGGGPHREGGPAHGAPPRPDASIHATINQRLQELQSRRQTHWRRLLDLIRGD